jgi:MFS family permease
MADAPQTPAPAPAAAGAHDAYQALRYPDFRRYLAGVSGLFMATQIQTAILGYQVYRITQDPFSLGLIGLSEALPFLGLTLFGGYVADRRDRRRVSLAAMAVLFAGALLLLGLNAPDDLSVAWPFYAVQALAGLGRAFFRPASQALGTELVPREAYANAAAWRSSTFQMAMVAGPAVGGLLFALGGAPVAYGAEVLLMGLSVLAIFRVAPRPRPAPAAFDPMLRSLGEGVRFVFGQRLVLGALSLDLFAVLFGGAVALLPVFASDILEVGPDGYGVLRAAPAIGSVVMGLFLAHHPPERRAGRILLLCVAGFGLCWIGFALSTTFALSLFLLAASGALDNVSMVLRATLVQTLTPPEMMGRVQAVNGFFIGSSNEVGAFESGLAARLLGVVPSVVFGGLVTLGVVGVTAWQVPELRRLKRIE